MIMMYQVHTIRKGYDRYYTMCAKRNLTREEAYALRDKRMANVKRTCDYVVVADSKEQFFYDEVARLSAPLMARAEALAKKKEQRWKEMDEMYKKGYKVHDAIAYLNR